MQGGNEAAQQAEHFYQISVIRFYVIIMWELKELLLAW